MDIETIKKWVDEKVKIFGHIDFVKSGNYIYNLEVSGRGNDNRCTWCSSFRTALKTHFGDLIEQIDDCPLR